MEQIRLDKAISVLGEHSRRDVKKLVSQGQITVNGRAARGAEEKIDPERDEVRICGRKVSLTPHVYLMLNKPQGVVSATRDPSEKTVVDLVPRELYRRDIFPAGRLDKDTTGFVLLTNDGALAHRILSPKNHIPKTYIAVLDRPVDQKAVELFAAGMDLGDGEICRPALLAEEPSWEVQPAARIVLREGLYHQIKRMFAKTDRKVLALRRIAMGGVALDPELAPGCCRELTAEEREMLTRETADYSTCTRGLE